MDKAQALNYVKAAAVALALPLDDARAERVAGHLVLSAAFAQALEAYPLRPHDEPAELYCPAPFSTSHGGRRWP
jgi:hypothetical protein